MRGGIYYGDPVNRAHPLARGLASWWIPPPWYSSGPRLIDVCGRSHGTLTNGPTWVPGPNGFGALSFDGTDDYVAVPGGPNVTADVTVAALVRYTTSGIKVVYGGYSTVGSSPGVGLAVGINAGGKADAWVGVSWFGANTASNDGLWHLIGFSLSGTTLTHYRDGQPDGATTQAADTSNAGANGTVVFPGTVGAVSVWDRSLPAAGWSALYDQSRRGYPDLIRRVRPWSFGVSAAGGTTSASYSGSSTASGSLARLVSKALAGSATPSGAPARQAQKPLAGSLAPSGVLAKVAAKALAGSGTPSGAAAKAVAKPLAGSSTPSAALAALKVAVRSVGGSCAASGTVAKSASKAVAGSATPSGAIVKSASKAIEGSVGNPLSGGPAAYYKLDNSLLDSSGNGRDMTPGTTPVYGSPGKLGSGYLAAGTGTLTGLSVPYTGLTVSCWVQFDNSGALAQGSVSVTTPAGVFALRPTNSSRVVQVRLGAAVLLTSAAASASTWHHFAATSDASGNVALYVDGVVTGTTTGGPTPDSFTDLGVAASTSRVLLDEAAFFDRAVSAAEVRALFNDDLGYDPTSPKITGAAAKAVAKPLAGSSTPSAALAALKVAVRSVGGAVSAVGSLARFATKALAGSATPSGATAKQAQKPLAGSATPSGALSAVKVVLRSLGGSVSAAGSLAKSVFKALAGLVAGSGELSTSGGSSEVPYAKWPRVTVPGADDSLVAVPGSDDSLVAVPGGTEV